MPKNKNSNIDGWFILDKPINISSAKAVNAVKKYFNIKLKRLSEYRKMNMKSLYSRNNSNYYISLRKTLKDLRLFLKKR